MIVAMTKNHPHDYMPAAQHDALLPAYDLISRALGIAKVHRTLVGQAEVTDGHRVLEIGSGTGTLTIRAKRSRPGADVIGIDPDPLALARAHESCMAECGFASIMATPKSCRITTANSTGCCRR